MSTNGRPSPCCRQSRPLLDRGWLQGQARAFKALGDPTRLEMLDLLARAKGSLCVCDIESRFDLAQPTISHHLGVLRKTGLVTTERRGTWMHYRLAPGCIEHLADFVGSLAAASHEPEQGRHHA